MDTAAISYRVADFLKAHPPFNAMDEADLLELASRGRVKFHEANDYILWQGQPNQFKVFVIQQGTVALWDEQGERPELRDVRGAGDMLAVEQFAGADTCAYSARSSTDVLIYVFPAFDFEALVLKYPVARQYVAAYGDVTADYRGLNERRQAHDVFLHELTAQRTLQTCDEHTSIRDAAQTLQSAAADAVAVVDADHRALGVLTADTLLAWVADGAGDADQPVRTLVRRAPPAVAPDASVAEGLLALAETGGSALAITSDGSLGGQLQAVVTPRDFSPVFGDQPLAILREIPQATSIRELRALNQRVRAFALAHLATAASFDWIARVTHLADVAVVGRLIGLTGQESAEACWCVCGSSGRQESLTRLAPLVVLITDGAPAPGAHQAVWDALAECDYLPQHHLPFDASFYAASVGDWTKRYAGWLDDPVMNQFYQSRAMLDLRPIAGRRDLWEAISRAVAARANRRFLTLMANDCLDSLPPLTFFQDAVVDDSGAESGVFELQRSALGPLVDVGRVFAVAAGTPLGSSTLERYAMARKLLPDHESIFREAADTLRVVLWQQARVGISQGTDGAELPPTLLSRYDRQVLKAGFRSIHRLIAFTAEGHWLETL